MEKSKIKLYLDPIPILEEITTKHGVAFPITIVGFWYQEFGDGEVLTVRFSNNKRVDNDPPLDRIVIGYDAAENICVVNIYAPRRFLAT